MKKNATKHTNNCVQHISKHCANCKNETIKKNVSLILILQSKKKRQQHRKKTKHQRNVHTKRFCIAAVCCICAKAHNARKKHQSKPGQLDLASKNENEIFEVFLSVGPSGQFLTTCWLPESLSQSKTWRGFKAANAAYASSQMRSSVTPSTPLL